MITVTLPCLPQQRSATARGTRSETNPLLRFIERGLLHIGVIVVRAIWIVRTVALLVSSFRSANLVASTGWRTSFSPPVQFTLDLYQQSFGREGMAQSFVNSLFISIPATIIPIMIAAFAAYAFAWMDFSGTNVLFAMVVGLLVVPLQITQFPVLRLYNTFQLTGTFQGIWLAHAAYGLPFAVYLLRNFSLCRQLHRTQSFSSCGFGMTSWSPLSISAAIQASLP